jgi:hypothetical protein
MDRVDLHEDYDPVSHYRLELDDGKLTPEELAAKHGTPIEAADAEAPEDEEQPRAEKPKRLDG